MKKSFLPTDKNFKNNAVKRVFADEKSLLVVNCKSYNHFNEITQFAANNLGANFLHMQKMSFYFLALAMVCAIVSCSKSSSSTSDESSGNWIKRSEFAGSQRTEAASFAVGDSAYVGTGYDGENRLPDFWLYNATTDSWSQRALFPGVRRNSAVGFAVGGKGYIATGFDGTNKLKDCWRFNPATNQWQQMNDFAGNARYDAVSFTIGDTAYIATGYADNTYGGSSNLKDFWAYDASADKWIERQNYGGDKRSQAVSFVHGNRGYIVTGTNNGTNLTDFWQYDPASGVWSQLRKINNATDSSFDDDYSDIIRTNAAAFVMGDYAYLTTGANGANTVKTWKYDFSSDQWTRKTPFEGSSRIGANSFVVKGRGFVTMGSSSSGSTTNYDDIWEFNPDQEQTSADN